MFESVHAQSRRSITEIHKLATAAYEAMDVLVRNAQFDPFKVRCSLNVQTGESARCVVRMPQQ